MDILWVNNECRLEADPLMNSVEISMHLDIQCEAHVDN